MPTNTIIRRDRRLGREGHPRWWLGGDPAASAFYNALSSTFPEGERFFVESVKAYRDNLSADLRKRVDDFVYQESIHSREHTAFNGFANSHGASLVAAGLRTRAELDEARAYPKIAQLAMTVGLEHLTAIFASEILSNGRHLQDATPAARELWLWHAVEEIEHKDVAHETYHVAAQEFSAFTRWSIRAQTMVVATLTIAKLVKLSIREQLVAANALSEQRRIPSYLVFRPGLLRRLLPRYLAYYLPYFRPGWWDDSRLLERSRSELGLAVAA